MLWFWVYFHCDGNSFAAIYNINFDLTHEKPFTQNEQEDHEWNRKNLIYSSFIVGRVHKISVFPRFAQE